MPQKVFTVQFDVTGSEADYLNFTKQLTQLPHIANLKTLKSEPVSRVKYPAAGIYSVSTITVIFDGKVSKDAVEAVIEYWNAINYVAGVQSVDWENGAAKITFNASKSPSSDLGKRNILELLLSFIEDGTPIRTQHPYGQAAAGIGKYKVLSLVGK